MCDCVTFPKVLNAIIVQLRVAMENRDALDATITLDGVDALHYVGHRISPQSGGQTSEVNTR